MLENLKRDFFWLEVVKDNIYKTVRKYMLRLIEKTFPWFEGTIINLRHLNK